MSLYIGIHKNLPEMDINAMVDAHHKDLDVQGKHGVKFLKYWYNETEGSVRNILCLCEAPSKEAANAVHQEAHGCLADEIIEVKEGPM